MRLKFKAQGEMHAFHFEMCAFEMHKTADFHSNLPVSWELMTKGYQGRPVKCAHFTLKCVHFERSLPGMVILWFQYFDQQKLSQPLFEENILC